MLPSTSIQQKHKGIFWCISWAKMITEVCVRCAVVAVLMGKLETQRRQMPYKQQGQDNSGSYGSCLGWKRATESEASSWTWYTGYSLINGLDTGLGCFIR